MKIDSVAAEYLKLYPTTTYHAVPETGKENGKSADNNLQNNKDVGSQKSVENGLNASNPVLRELLTKDEKKTLKDLFGTESMAQINKVLNSNGEKIGELPRGILVNVKV